MNEDFFRLAQIGLTVAIEALMANDKANLIIREMVASNRTTLTADEIAALDDESNMIHAAHLEEIAKAKAEGR